jgi:serine/threonine protein kinase
VLLGAAGAQLADFGIARFEAEMFTGPMTRLTETAAVLGTLPYMSPEQRRGGAVDRRSDLFSAGVMLYEAATGVLPQGAFAPPSELNPAYGRAFDRIVIQLLQADPPRRPAGAAEVAAALAAALAPRRQRRRALALAGAALAVAIGGGAVGARFMFRDHVEKFADKESAAPAATKAVSPAAATTTTVRPPEPTPAAAAVPDEPTAPDTELTKAAPDEKQPPRAKTRHRLVLKAVSDVKNLRRAAVTSGIKSEKPTPTGKKGKKGKQAEAPSLDEGLEPFDAKTKRE